MACSTVAMKRTGLDLAKAESELKAASNGIKIIHRSTDWGAMTAAVKRLLKAIEWFQAANEAHQKAKKDYLLCIVSEV